MAFSQTWNLLIGCVCNVNLVDGSRRFLWAVSSFFSEETDSAALSFFLECAKEVKEVVVVEVLS